MRIHLSELKQIIREEVAALTVARFNSIAARSGHTCETPFRLGFDAETGGLH